MRISVIIPTYNRRDFLEACLDSVFAQRRPPDEVIVVDDGSTDGTRDLVAAMPAVRLIEQQNAGPGAARNRGAAEASGDYLAFLDSDDLWFPWSLEVIAEAIERFHGPSLLFASFRNFAGPAIPEAEIATLEARAYKDFLASAPDGCFAGAGMMIVRRDAFMAVGGFETSRMNAEDHDLALRLGVAPGFVQISAPLIVAHRVHEGNLMGNASNNIEGLVRIVTRENSAGYPGETIREHERRQIVNRHVRAVLLSGVDRGALSLAAGLYLKTFIWNLSECRFRYLAAAPIFLFLAALRREARGN